MRRLQLIEVLDQPWCPHSLRDTLTAYLQFSISLNNPYLTIVPLFAQALQATNMTCIVDMCSGAGGPWPRLRTALEAELARPLTLFLTDRFPYTSSRLSAPIPIIAADARALPIHTPVFRTVFAGFHHFAPSDAQRVLQDAVKEHHGIAIFEITQRRVTPMLVILLSAIALLLTTPIIRPWRWSRFIWTYLIPVAPLILILDGLVSCLRTYTPDEMRDLVSHLDQANYAWHIGEIAVPKTPLTVTYTIGYPQHT